MSGINEPGKVRCERCGAYFDANESVCPYCDLPYAPNQERDYMEHLGSIKKDMGKLGGEGKKAVKAELKESAHMIRVTVVVVLLIAAAVAVLGTVVMSQIEKREKEEYAKTKAAEEELDAMYEEGDYDGICEKIMSCEDEGVSIYTWDHYAFGKVIRNVGYARGVIEEIDGEPDEEWLEILLRYEAPVVYTDVNKDLTIDERAIIAEYAADVIEDYEKNFSPTQEEERAFKADVGHYGYVTSSTAEAYFEARQ